jgi:uncharacterized protein (DUF2141 family)
MKHVVSLALLFAISMAAQNNGRIEGRAVDSQQGALPQATVELLQGAKEIRKQVTDATGRFVFEGLSAGPYALRIARAGFEKFSQDVTVAD